MLFPKNTRSLPLQGLAILSGGVFVGYVGYKVKQLLADRKFRSEMQQDRKNCQNLYLVKNENLKMNLNDIIGHEDAKLEIIKIVNPLKFPEKVDSKINPLYSKISAMPRTLLLFTLLDENRGADCLVKATAKQIGANLLMISGNRLKERVTGQIDISEIFNLAEDLSDKNDNISIIYINNLEKINENEDHEIFEALVSKIQDMKQDVKQATSTSKSRIILIGSTENIFDFDDNKDWKRKKVFDRIVELKSPNIHDRRIYLEQKLKGLVPDNNLCDISKKFSVCSQSVDSIGDLEKIINEALLLAAAQGQTKLTFKYLMKAQLIYKQDNNTTENVREQSLVFKEDLRTTAYHEAGHFVGVAQVLEKF